MQKMIMKDPLFLSQKSTAADPKADAQVVRDLQDTLRANRDRCVGMAGNCFLKRAMGSPSSFPIVRKKKKRKRKGLTLT